MESFSVILTACNNAAVLPRTLQSLRDAVAFAQSYDALGGVRAEVLAVNDGSADGTGELLDAFSRATGYTRVLHRTRPSSPACARNVGVAASCGDVLFFLDGDDLYRPEHLAVCFQVLRESGAEFVKAGVHLADPVHPDWRPRIEHSVVLNLGVRRRCHEAVGGFPDDHLFAREGDGFRHVCDLFYKYEDMFYNELLASLFAGVRVNRETVEYLRHPGNSYDRQYEKFRRPFGAHPDGLSAEDRFRLRLGEVILHERLRRLREEVKAAR